MAPSGTFPADPRGPTARFGDLLPLPVGQPQALGHHRVGRAVQQRRARKERLGLAVDLSAAATNILAGFTEESLWPRSCLNAAQQSTIDRLWTLHAEDRDNFLASEASLSEMLKTSGGYTAAVGELAADTDGDVSLPSGVVPPVPLVDVVSGEAHECVSDPLRRMLLSDEEIASVLADTETPGLYTDPCLAHNPRADASFIVRLYKAGLLRFDVKTRSQVGLFFSTTKNARDRFDW